MMNKSQPEIRFPEFDNDWKLQKIEEIFSERSERSSEGDLISVTINSGVVKASELDRKDNSSNDKSNYKKVEIGDIAYNSMRMWQGASGYSKYNGILSPAYTVITPKKGVDSKFFAYDFKRYDRIQTFKRNSQGLTSDTWNLKFPMLKSIKIMVPNLEEQKKISTFFKQLDDTIVLYQQKLINIKQTKQGLLQKLFPKEGKKVPEIRFPGFTDTWERCQFEKCFDFPVSTNSLSRAQLNYNEGDLKSVHYGDILVKYAAILEVGNDKIPYITNGLLDKYRSNLLENGDLIFADAAEDETVGKAVEVTGITIENLVAGLHTIVARPKEKKGKYFLGYYINSDIYHRQLFRLMQGTKVSSISKGSLQKTIVTFPKSFEEQEKIGNFFKQLDDTITLYQRELDLLQETKKAFLQKMFI